MANRAQLNSSRRPLGHGQHARYQEDALLQVYDNLASNLKQCYPWSRENRKGGRMPGVCHSVRVANRPRFPLVERFLSRRCPSMLNRSTYKSSASSRARALLSLTHLRAPHHDCMTLASLSRQSFLPVHGSRACPTSSIVTIHMPKHFVQYVPPQNKRPIDSASCHQLQETEVFDLLLYLSVKALTPSTD